MFSSITGTVAAWIICILGVLLLATVTIEEIRIGNWSDEVDTLNKNITNLHDDLATCHGNVATLGDSLDKQNKTIKQMAIDAAAKQDSSDAAVAAVMAKKPIFAKGSGPDSMNAWLHQEYRVTK